MLKQLFIIGIVLLTLVQVVSGVLMERGFLSDEMFGCDLRFRRNEILCAHAGVNPFHIWNRETTFKDFVSHPRPDYADPQLTSAEKVVHAYPPWHTAMFWFYGWMSDRLCTTLMGFVFGLCFAFVVYEGVRLVRSRFAEHAGPVLLFSLMLISGYATQCFISMNYGILILAALLLMNRAVEKGHDVAAGLCWAVMMIKPQIGILFAWPLFWHRRSLAIATAVAVCLGATVVTSCVLHEPVVDLILQVAQLGAPYGTGGLRDWFKPVFADSATYVLMVAFFVLTGVVTRTMRGKNDFILSCVPVCLFVPLWTYSGWNDRVIFLPAFIVMAGLMFSTRKFSRWAVVACLYCAGSVFLRGWSIADYFNLFDSHRLFWINHLVSYGSWCVLMVFLMMFLREEDRRPAGAKISASTATAND